MHHAKCKEPCYGKSNYGERFIPKGGKSRGTNMVGFGVFHRGAIWTGCQEHCCKDSQSGPVVKCRLAPLLSTVIEQRHQLKGGRSSSILIFRILPSEPSVLCEYPVVGALRGLCRQQISSVSTPQRCVLFWNCPIGVSGFS